MPDISISNFKGFTSKPDGTNLDPAVAVQAENCIINKGDICNLPYIVGGVVTLHQGFIDRYSSLDRYVIKQIFEFNDQLLTFYTYRENNTRKLECSFSANMDPSLGYNILRGSVLLGHNFLVRLMWPEDSQAYSLQGNLLKVGNSIFWVGLFANLLPKADYVAQDGSTLVEYTTEPKMVRIKSLVDESGANVFTAHFLGVDPPLEATANTLDSVAVYTVANGTVGDFELGITFVDGRLDEADPSIPDVRHNFQRQLSDTYTESNMINVMPDATSNDGTTFPRLKIWLHPALDSMTLDFRACIGIYVRPAGKDFFYRVGFSSLNDVRHDTTLNRYYVNWNHTALLDQGEVPDFDPDLTVTAPITGDSIPIIGAHDIPRPAYCAELFLNRVYYNLIQERVKPKNIMQVSGLPDPFNGDISISGQYIEKLEFVGKDSEEITGFIVYSGQLIIFKETEIYYMTRDIAEQGPRLLFSGYGCCNRERGGRAYIVADAKLFWADYNGIYQWDGYNPPIDISEPIEEIYGDISKLFLQYMRFSVDTDLNLLFCCLLPPPAGGNVPPKYFTLIYNYKDQAWTGLSYKESIYQWLRHKSDVISAQRGGVYNRGRLNEGADLQTAEETEMTWKSTVIDGGTDKRKHWKYIRKVDRLKAEDLKIKIDGDAEQVFTDTVKVGKKTETLEIEVTALTGKPFRINRLVLDAHVLGRSDG